MLCAPDKMQTGTHQHHQHNKPTSRQQHIRTRRALRCHATPYTAATLPSGKPAPLIKLIATDVDGTLLNSKQELSPRVEAAVKSAASVGVPMVVATGKARGPWVQEVFSRLDLATPGVFLQGLYVCDAEGAVLHQQELEHQVLLDLIQLADDKGLRSIVYCGADRILSASLDQYTDSLKFYKEPLVEAVGHLSNSVGKIAMQKLIYMGPQNEIDALRPVVEERMQGRASTTTAVPGMLEVLPLGASKGTGLSWLLKHMGVAPADVLALGDGENDVEMLSLVGLGVAMGNAGSKARAVSQDVMSTNDEDGVAQAIEKYVLAPRGTSIQEQLTVTAVSSRQ